MARGEIVIDEMLCKGCGYCVKFCNRGCIEITGDKFTPQGFLLPSFVNQENCNACAVCGWMCPDFAIEVYKFVEEKV
ncbi:MAG: ferredoxin family protein [Chloroflexota bacterium]|nr:ferredoxin family protein [Chloroflexota bacterium]